VSEEAGVAGVGAGVVLTGTGAAGLGAGWSLDSAWNFTLFVSCGGSAPSTTSITFPSLKIREWEMNIVENM